MNKNSGFAQTTAIAAALVLIVGAGVVWAVVQNGNKEQDNAMMEDKSGDEMMDDDKMDQDAMPAGNDAMMEDDKTDGSDQMMMKSGAYKDYSSAAVEAEQQSGNKVVLFFHASWCPFCKAANEAFSSRTSEIPAGVVVLKTDYDSNTALRQKYGVTYQHTFVQIDNDENLVSKWNGGDIDNLKKYLK